MATILNPQTGQPVNVPDALAAQLQQQAQQQASYSWANLLGFYDPNAPQNLSPNQLTLQAMNDLGFLTLPGQQGNMPTIPEQQTSGVYYDPTTGQWRATQSALASAGLVNIPGQGNTQTLAGQAQQAGLTGLIPTGMAGAGTATASQLGQAGLVNLGNGQMTNTLAANQAYLSAIQNLLANNNSATPFTYLAQQRGVSNLLSPTAQFLRGGILGGTGQTASQLAAQPNLTVSNAASQAQAQSGGKLGDFFGQMLNYLYNSVPAGSHDQATGMLGASQPASSGGNNITWHRDQNGNWVGVPASNMPGPGEMGTNFLLGGGNGPTPNTGGLGGGASQPYSTNWNGTTGQTTVNGPGGMTGQLPFRTSGGNAAGGLLNLLTGFGTSQQALSRMSPTAQSAYQNLIQTAGGENPQDFAAGVKAAAPEFAKSGPGVLSSVGSL